MCKREDDAVEARISAADKLLDSVTKRRRPLALLGVSRTVVEPSRDPLHVAYNGPVVDGMPEDFFDKLRKIA